MSQHISHSQTRIDVGDGMPIVIDVETAVDEVYTALSKERRRLALCVLMRESIPMELETLVEKVAKRENPDALEAPSGEFKRQVRLTLYHSHLPKLESLDLIEFDADELVVKRVSDPVSSVSM
jgi:hypothetical protein